MSLQTLDDWLALLETRHPTAIDLGLERVAAVAGNLGLVGVKNRAIATHVVVVAGTNGKGSCVAALEQLLLADGFRVGAYTSPHLIDYNERIRLQGQPVSNKAICGAFARIEAARGSISLTYFEFGTLAAMLVMAESNVDVAILEVGLGGRLDAVNILDADIAIVTSIALDHEEWLGNDLDVIAAEKAAICRPHKPLLCGDSEPRKGLLQVAAQQHAQLLINGDDFNSTDELDCTGVLEHFPAASVACAVQAFKIITGNKPSHPALAALSQYQLPGRFQQLSHLGLPVILDVAHNPHAAKLLATRIKAMAEQSVRGLELVAIFGMMRDKDIDATITPLLPFVSHWHCCDIPAQTRAASSEILRDRLLACWRDNRDTGEMKSCQLSCHPSPEEAFISVTEDLLQAAKCKPHGEGRLTQVLVFGSFFTVGPVLKHIQDKTNLSSASLSSTYLSKDLL